MSHSFANTTIHKQYKGLLESSGSKRAESGRPLGPLEGVQLQL